MFAFAKGQWLSAFAAMVADLEKYCRLWLKNLKKLRRLQCNYFGTSTSSCWQKRQWFMDLHPFCIFVIFVNMNFLNCCKDGFFCKNVFKVYIKSKPLYILELCNTLSLVFIFSKISEFHCEPLSKMCPKSLIT